MIEYVEGGDTGIYSEGRLTARVNDKVAFRELGEMVREAYDFQYQIGSIEQRALAVLREAGFPDWPIRSDSTPIVQDAADVWGFIRDLRSDLVQGGPRDSLILRIGSIAERMGVRPSEPYVLRSRKQLEGAKRGHERAYGTEAEKAARRAAVIATWEHIRLENPAWSDRAVNEQTGKLEGISTKTVQRYRHKS